MLDNEDPRKIKVKKNAVGGVEDVTDELAPETGEESEDEVFLELPEEYDEDLVGLTPSQLQKELERREKAAEEARAERDRLLAAAEEYLAKGSYEEAEPLFSQALLYDPESARAGEGVWICRTRNFKDLEPLYELENAQEINYSVPVTKAFVRARAGEKLKADRAEYEAEAAPLEESFAGAQDERREAFRDNRNYYLVRFLACTVLFFLFGISAGISATFVYRTQEITPFILIGVFGGLALVFLVVGVIFSRKLLVAQRLCNENEKLSSTEEGARLSYLRGRLLCLKLILDDEE